MAGVGCSCLCAPNAELAGSLAGPWEALLASLHPALSQEHGTVSHAWCASLHLPCSHAAAQKLTLVQKSPPPVPVPRPPPVRVRSLYQAKNAPRIPSRSSVLHLTIQGSPCLPHLLVGTVSLPISPQHSVWKARVVFTERALFTRIQVSAAPLLFMSPKPASEKSENSGDKTHHCCPSTRLLRVCPCPQVSVTTHLPWGRDAGEVSLFLSLCTVSICSYRIPFLSGHFSHLLKRLPLSWLARCFILSLIIFIINLNLREKPKVIPAPG